MSPGVVPRASGEAMRRLATFQDFLALRRRIADPLPAKQHDPISCLMVHITALPIALRA
jgi:hypothetical protein